MPLQIKKVPFGIACRIGETIYVHKDLEEYDKELYDQIIFHEMNHSNKFTLKDISMDLDNKEIKGFKGRYYGFILTHPSSLSELLPVWRYEGSFVFNPLLTSFYLIVGGIVWIIASLVR